MSSKQRRASAREPGRAWIRIPAKLQDAGVGAVAARKPRRLRTDLMRVAAGLLSPAVASSPPAGGRPALYDKGRISTTNYGEKVFLFLVRRKWDYSKCHKRRRQARRARFAPILDLRASLPRTGTDGTAISSQRLTRISQMLATLREKRDAHTQQHRQRWRLDDIWLDREPGEREMVPRLRALAAAAALMLAVSDGETAFAEKSGGVLKIGQFDSPAGMSILEESSNTAEGPMMGVFNNLVLYDQHEPQNSLQSIQPDLATGWLWDEDRTRLTFHLRHGVKWHDGKPFTAADVKCTWDLLQGRASEKLRLNPRKAWYRNVQEVAATGDDEVTFHLQRPQPALLALLASGWAPVYPCHVGPRDMRQHPIGTGPFKFVEFKPNEVIRVNRNPEYWKPGRPYLDGIEYHIIKNPSTRLLALAGGGIDMIQPYTVTPPLLKEVMSQVPQAICDLVPQNISRDLLINRSRPPFDNRDLRLAMALSLDRKSFIDILEDGKGDIGAAMLPPPEGQWGMPLEMV